MRLWLRFHRDLWAIEREINRTRRSARRLKEAASEKRSKDDLVAIAEQEQTAIARLENEIAETVSIYLLDRAASLGIPTPDASAENTWERSRSTGMRRLNEESLAALRAAIRREKKERLQLWEARARIFAPCLTGLTGLLGAVIGLIAMFR